MRILLTNDDGLHAVGHRKLHDALDSQNRHELLAVAPEGVQSATSHALTFESPLHISREPLGNDTEGVAVRGRPADCVKLGLSAFWPQRFGPGTQPELILSGINMGANCGINHLYSGTVAAAREGAIQSIPSIAFSLSLSDGTPRWELAARWSLEVLDLLLQGPLSPRICLSVNLPPAEQESPLPLRVCPMNDHPCADRYERRWSPRGGEYYWPAGYGDSHRKVDPGTDVEAVSTGHISITPLRLDLTEHEVLGSWREALGLRS